MFNHKEVIDEFVIIEFSSTAQVFVGTPTLEDEILKRHVGWISKGTNTACSVRTTMAWDTAKGVERVIFKRSVDEWIGLLHVCKESRCGYFVGRRCR